MSDSLSGMDPIIRAHEIVKKLAGRATSSASILPKDLDVLRKFELKEKGEVGDTSASITILVERYLVISDGSNEYSFKFTLSFNMYGEVVAEVIPWTWGEETMGEEPVKEEVVRRVDVKRKPLHIEPHLMPNGIMELIFYADVIADWLEKITDEVVAEFESYVNYIHSLADKARLLAVADRLSSE
ncbi:MAG: hypothetical protein ACP5RJ_08365 [Conexivisphaera sp.]